jgi:hypothetical protein
MRQETITQRKRFRISDFGLPGGSNQLEMFPHTRNPKSESAFAMRYNSPHERWHNLVNLLGAT